MHDIFTEPTLILSPNMYDKVYEKQNYYQSPAGMFILSWDYFCPKTSRTPNEAASVCCDALVYTANFGAPTPL